MANVLNVSHFRQITDGYCLAACAQMALDYLGIPVAQEELARRLEVRPRIGAPSSRLLRLRSETLDVVYADGDLYDLLAWLEAGTPVIVFVQVDQLPYWQGQHFQHALLLTGSDAESLYLLDPAADSAPIAVSQGDFLLAWDEMECVYAVIRQREETPFSALPDL
ncbi:MAG TPA: C39 family peptidase [Anaerolineae bacterium]|nr:C39 family peptidase [Anaerolineae bacterium]HQK13604.1 C39 family peptidase [Anaerolineae bacterium]